MEEAVECDGGDPGLVTSRDRLHRRDVHEGREAHVRPGGQDPRSIAPLQFQLGAIGAALCENGLEKAAAIDAGFYLLISLCAPIDQPRVGNG